MLWIGTAMLVALDWHFRAFLFSSEPFCVVWYLWASYSAIYFFNRAEQWRNQLVPACAQRRSQKVNQATPSHSHSPVKAPVPVRTHCTNAWWNRCKTDLNSFPHRKLDETTGTSSYYMDENHSAGSEIQRPLYGRRSWPGSEPSTLEIDVYLRRYALLVVLARNDDDDECSLVWVRKVVRLSKILAENSISLLPSLLWVLQRRRVGLSALLQTLVMPHAVIFVYTVLKSVVLYCRNTLVLMYFAVEKFRESISVNFD